MLKNRLASGLTCVAFAFMASATMFAQSTVKPFDLPSTTSETTHVAADNTTKLTVIYFTGIECPLAQLYAPRIALLAKEYSDRSIRFIGVNSNQQDSMKELTEFVAQHNIPFPVGKDFNNVVADQLDVRRTPEVIVVDQKFNIRYRGRIDDQYMPGVSRNKANREDLKIAIDELLAGKAVSQPRTQPEGCLLGRVKKPITDGNVTFANQVSRVLQKNCVECHRDGEIGPFVLDDYEEVVGWADMIVETIDNGRMPPWHADPKHGSFLNQRNLSAADKELVRKWVADGAPFGNASELPQKQKFVKGWRLPKEPDLIVPMRKRPFTIPGDGTVEYQYFVVDPKFETDKWVSAAEVIPGNHGVVHHSIVFIRPPDGSAFRGVGWLAAYVPGQKNLKYEPTRARRVPAGSKLVFQQHYTPNGSDQTDITKIGLVFADEKDIKEELLTLISVDQQFEIQPNDPSHQVTTSLDWFPKNAKLLSVSPHMHYRGKSFAAHLKTNDKQTTLLSVPNYDFNWQHVYQLEEPISLDDVTSVVSEVTFDNSSDNPFNPNPEELVTWGDQTWEEMAVAFFDVSVTRNPPKQDSPVKKIVEGNNATPKREIITPARQNKIDQFVVEFFNRFDANKDDLVTRNELPMVMRWDYSSYNSNNDEGLSRAEIATQAERRIK